MNWKFFKGKGMQPSSHMYDVHNSLEFCCYHISSLELKYQKTYFLKSVYMHFIILYNFVLYVCTYDRYTQHICVDNLGSHVMCILLVYYNLYLLNYEWDQNLVKRHYAFFSSMISFHQQNNTGLHRIKYLYL